ncbi:class I SAM-dependent methyltransferase [Aeromicrobium sp. CTD01-1L150]|uniref:class I SAM-dependent methyltransferase n=1 Tax=Aeromicrobium sp. CTD01-1L150 TaxID=3341830 RepID=UPI0035C19F43
MAEHRGDQEADLSFLAPTAELADWRLVLAYESAAEAGALAALPGTADELATAAGLDVRGLRPVLGVLAAWEMLVVDPDGVYAPGRQLPDALADTALRRHGAAIRRWAGMLGPRLHDRSAMPTRIELPVMRPSTGPDLLALNARRVAPQIVDLCQRVHPRIKRALDLGGGHGEHALELARRGVHSVVQDLPHVVARAQEQGRLEPAGVEVFAGDLRTDLPVGPFDLVLCSTVTNMFDGGEVAALLVRVRSVLAPGGLVAVASFMRGRDEVAAVFGLQMLAWTDGGDAHGVQDYGRWFADAGMRVVAVEDLDRPRLTVVLATAADLGPDEETRAQSLT